MEQDTEIDKNGSDAGVRRYEYDHDNKNEERLLLQRKVDSWKKRTQENVDRSKRKTKLEKRTT